MTTRLAILAALGLLLAGCDPTMMGMAGAPADVPAMTEVPEAAAGTSPATDTAGAMTTADL